MPITIIFYFLALLFTYRLFRRVSHPVVVFNLMWLVLLTISLYGNLDKVLDIYQPSQYIYDIFFVGGISFNFGAFLFHILTQKKNKTTVPINTFSITPKKIYFFYALEIVLFVYYFFESIDLLRLLASGQTYEVVRRFYFSEEMMTSIWKQLVILYVFDPLLTLTVILFAINLFVGLLPRKLSCIMFLNVVMRTFISGGRTALFELGCLVILSALFLGRQLNFSRKKWVEIALGVFLLVFLVVKVSSGRHGDEGGIMEIAVNNLIIYFMGSFPFFDDLLQCKDYLPPMYGIVTLGGFFDIFIQLFRFIGFTDMDLTYVSTGAILEDFRPIGKTMTYNAMPTMYYYFYTDFRELGFVLCPLLFGGVSVMVYNNLQRSGTILSFIFYLILMILVFESSFNWQLERVSFFMVIVFAFLLFKEKRNYRTKSTNI